MDHLSALSAHIHRVCASVPGVQSYFLQIIKAQSPSLLISKIAVHVSADVRVLSAVRVLKMSASSLLALYSNHSL